MIPISYTIEENHLYWIIEIEIFNRPIKIRVYEIEQDIMCKQDFQKKYDFIKYINLPSSENSKDAEYALLYDHQDGHFYASFSCELS